MKGRRRLLWLTLGLLLAAALVWGGWKAARLFTLSRDAQASITRIERLLEKAEGFPALADLQSLQAELKKGRQQIHSLRSEMGPLLSLGPVLRIIPGVGKDMDKSPKLLKSAEAAAEAGWLAVDGLNPFLEVLEESGFRLVGPSSQASSLVDALDKERPQFLQAQDRLREAQRLLQEAREEELTSRLESYADRLGEVLRKLDLAVDLELAAPALARELLGTGDGSSFLVIAQNTYELRATGGFISAVWLLELEDGQIVRLDFHNSADVDDLTQRYPPPPLAINKYMLASIWVFRDTNWSPDFPTAATIAENLYFLGQRVRGDGMIAIDELALRDIIDVLGPVELKAFGEVVDATNIMSKLEEGLDPGLGPGPGDLPPRKFFLKVLFEELRERIEAGLTLEEASGLVAVLFKDMDEKHLIIYSHDQELAQFLARRGWDGSLRPYDGDTLMVVDSNVGYNKVNPMKQQSLEYAVAIQGDGSATGELLVSYVNTSSGPSGPCIQQATRGGYPEWKEGCYWDYLRVLVPRGSSLLPGTSYFPLPEGSLLRWLGKREDPNLPVAEPFTKERESFSNFFAIAPGESLPVRFRYSLPGEVLRQQGEEYIYSLLVQKQPGTQALPLKVRITYPDSLAPVRWSGAEGKASPGLLELETELRKDAEILVIFVTKR